MNRTLKKHVEREHARQQVELVIITIVVGLTPVYLGFWVIEALIK